MKHHVINVNQFGGTRRDWQNAKSDFCHLEKQQKEAYWSRDEVFSYDLRREDGGS